MKVVKRKSMFSVQGKPLTPEIKKLVVSVKHYFDRAKTTIGKPSAECTAEATGLGVATVKRIMADFNRDPKMLDKAPKVRGRCKEII